MKWYQVPGWPAQVPGHSAVAPHLTRLAGSGAQQYKDGLTGRPGTTPIPVPGPGVPQCQAGQAQMGLSRTQDSPASFRPNQYWARPEAAYWPGAGMPVSLVSDNLMPVPAVDPRGVPAVTQTPFLYRGQTQIQALPTLVSWPSR